MHGTADRTVPYGTDIIKLLNSIPLLTVHGSSSIHNALDRKGQDNYFYTYCGKDHVPYAGFGLEERAWMDTTIRFVSKYVYEKVLKCGNSGIVVPGGIDSSDCPTTGIPYCPVANSITIYPNPTQSSFTIENQFTGTKLCSIYNVSGQKIKTLTLKETENNVDVNELPNGVYIVKVENNNATYLQKLIIN
jgi:hypothetical protein